MKSFKFLGVIFDTRLTWRDLLSKVEDKCRRVMNLMRCLAGTEWGADVASLTQIYFYLIRAIIEYGCLVYGSAAKPVLAAFVVQRWIAQAFKRTSNFLTVFTVELYAILMAVQWTEQIQNHKYLCHSPNWVPVLVLPLGGAEFHQGTRCLSIVVFQAESREETELPADWLTPRAWFSLTF